MQVCVSHEVRTQGMNVEKSEETVGRGKRSSVLLCTRRHSVKTSGGMFHWLPEDPEMGRTTPGTLIWCQAGGRNKIYTHQHEAFNSLAMCPPTSPPPYPYKRLSPICHKFSSYCHVLFHKKGEISA